MTERQSFWHSLPGIITAVAGLLTAIGSLFAVYFQFIYEKPQSKSGNKQEETTPIKTLDQIWKEYARSIIPIHFLWRLYDETGRPIFHKMLFKSGEVCPAYVKLNDGRIVRWLVNDDEHRTNPPLGQAG